MTYHGPGQLVAYPIMAIDSVAEFVRTMEGRWWPRWATRASRPRPARRRSPGSGRATPRSASIGVHVSRGVTTHGLAVNVDNDLQPFEWILPCGIESGADDLGVARDRAGRPRCPASASSMAHRFAEAFGRRQRLVSERRLLEHQRAPEPVPA